MNYKERGVKQERLRMKFIKERELAESKDSDPDDLGEERKERKRTKKKIDP